MPPPEARPHEVRAFAHVVCTCRYSGASHGFVAQWIERLSPEQKVVGSNPIKPTEQAVAPVLRGGFTYFWVLGYRPKCVSGGGQVGGAVAFGAS